MLATKFRLPSSLSLKNSHFLKEDIFTVRFQKNSLDYARFGFVVAKSIDKRAVVRNMLKRMVRGRIESAWLKNKKNIDVLFVLRSPIKSTAKEEVFKKVDTVMERVYMA